MNIFSHRARCIGNAQDFDEKRLLFKYYKDPDDEVTYPAIVWKVLDGDEYVDVEKDQQLFWLNIKWVFAQGTET